MKIGITTATGQLGTAILSQVIKRIERSDVVAIARSPHKFSHTNIESRKGDYDRLDNLIAAFQGLDTVMFVSGNTPPEIRLRQHLNVVEAAVTANVKKVVFSGILVDGYAEGFRAVQDVSLATEKALINSGLQWAIGRNGIYLDPDLEYIDTYIKEGKVSNCAGEGKCAYTARSELAIAYADLLVDDQLNGKIYNLVGESVTQQQLTDYINDFFNVNLSYESMSVEAYRQDRTQAFNSDMFDNIITGIYENIRNGGFDANSDYASVTGRSHKTIRELFANFKESYM
ncbi:MAG: NAD(P)H-binding protein [Cyanobacteria bacterium J06629_2]